MESPAKPQSSFERTLGRTTGCKSEPRYPANCNPLDLQVSAKLFKKRASASSLVGSMEKLESFFFNVSDVIQSPGETFEPSVAVATSCLIFENDGEKCVPHVYMRVDVMASID